MQNTHRVLPLNAYDINGDLIPPTDYKSKIQGALVRLEFSMMHWTIWKGKKATDTFVANIVSLQVLDEPKPLLKLSPSKGLVRNRDPLDSDDDSENERVKRAKTATD